MNSTHSPDEPASTPPESTSGPAPEPSANGPAPEPVPAEAVHSGDDRRSHPRRKKLLRVQIVDTLNESDTFPGWVVDRSFGGLRLEVERPIEAGCVLRVRNSFAAPMTPWVEVKVQSSQEHEGYRYLGCAFVRSPTWEVLMQFG